MPEIGPMIDRNFSQVVLASAARAATVVSGRMTNPWHQHVLLTLDLSVRTAAETLQLYLQLLDPISGAYWTVWTAAAATGVVALYTYLLGPAAVAAVYTEDVHIVVPQYYRCGVTQVGVGPATYSVAASYVFH